MYLLIDTTKQNGSRIGHVVSKHRTFADAFAAWEAFYRQIKRVPRKGSTPVIWKGDGIAIGEAVMFADRRLSILSKAELKSLDSPETRQAKAKEKGSRA